MPANVSLYRATGRFEQAKQMYYNAFYERKPSDSRTRTLPNLQGCLNRQVAGSGLANFGVPRAF